jgi:DNA helicase IV
MHPDVPEEQAYFDRALDLRDRLEANLDRAATLAADPKTAMELRRRVGALGVVDPGQAVAFGRIDVGDQRWYIGRGAIWDENNELVVVNWQAPVAAPFYTATPDAAEGLDRRRIYRCRDNRVLDIDELVFSGVAAAVAAAASDDRPPEPVLTDALLDTLSSGRSGQLREIVATIQAAQYDVISRDAEQLLVVQGAPGTGKTVVGLHRVSWLLFNRRDRLKPRDVLVVGPNQAFIRYISAVLPQLGDEAVVQLPVTALGPRVRLGRVDPPAVRRLKGDRRMLRLLLRGLRNRQRISRGTVELTVEGRRVQVEGDMLAARARQLAGYPHNDARRELRNYVIDEVQRQINRRTAAFGGFGDPDDDDLDGAGSANGGGHVGGRGLTPGYDVVVQGEAARDIDRYFDRVWPSLTPEAFLVELFSTRRQLEGAAAGLLASEEIELLSLARDATVSTMQWSVDDIPLLDLADVLLNGAPASYEHIVVDEAQDLSPMQFESIRRRSRTGWMTLLGDLAQATSPWAPTSWEEVALHLRRDRVPSETTELTFGYRLPGEVHQVAMRLLPEIAPRLAVPDPLRSSGYAVEVDAVRSDELGDAVARVVRSFEGRGLVAVITPNRVREAVTEALEDAELDWSSELDPDGDPVVVLGPEESKGLEFDNVVVVEPARIAAESPQGLRALFVALTRPTNRLAIVHAEELPEVLRLDSPLPAPLPPLPPPRSLAAPAVTSSRGVVVEPGTNGTASRPAPLPPLAPPSPTPPSPAPVAQVAHEHRGNGSAVPWPSSPVPSPPPPPARERRVEPHAPPEPFAGLDREMAHAVASKLVEALSRYATPALIPHVVEQMAQILDIERPRQLGPGQPIDPGDRDRYGAPEDGYDPAGSYGPADSYGPAGRLPAGGYGPAGARGDRSDSTTS